MPSSREGRTNRSASRSVAVASGTGPGNSTAWPGPSVRPRVATLAFLGILDWKFLQPIAFGDTIRVVSRVAALEPRANGRRGVVTWHRRLVNQDGQVTVEPKALSSARVTGEVLSERKGGKVIVVKFKRRKNYRRHRGHRQTLTAVRITKIEV